MLYVYVVLLPVLVPFQSEVLILFPLPSPHPTNPPQTNKNKSCPAQNKDGPHLEDHPRTCKWLITMVSNVSKSPISRAGSLTNGPYMAYKWGWSQGDPNHWTIQDPGSPILLPHPWTTLPHPSTKVLPVPMSRPDLEKLQQCTAVWPFTRKGSRWLKEFKHFPPMASHTKTSGFDGDGWSLDRKVVERWGWWRWAFGNRGNLLPTKTPKE